MGSRRAPERPSAHPIALGVTDLMTSLAVIFVLLLVVLAGSATPSPPRSEPAPAPAPPAPRETGLAEVRAALERSSSLDLALEPDAHDPQVLRVVVPESLLRFEFGKSRLVPAADRFLTEVMPAYAAALCGPLRAHIGGVVIEGHTDDLGGDSLNLRLSQERSFRVLVRGLEVIRSVAPEAHACFAELASASGRGKQDLVYDGERRPDREGSRRVVLKILLRTAPAPA